jgi:hypothetical protein
MLSHAATLLTNIFPCGFVFDGPLEGFDFFRVEGIFPRTDRYEKLGNVVYQLELYEKVAFAKHFKSKDEDVVIGFLPEGPKKRQHNLDGLVVTYIGKQTLLPNEEGKRAFLELVYNMQRRKLRSSKYWSMGHDTAFPWEWKSLFEKYRCSLNFFRGPHFRYYFLSDGRLILVLDTKTHYIESRPFFEEILFRGKDLKWFQKEIVSEKERLGQHRKHFNGIYFHYILANKSVAMDGIDPRPISTITIEAEIGGKPWKGTVYDYLKLRYSRNKRVQKLDPSQPAVCKGSYPYAPQLLHRHVNLRQVPKEILNENTFLMDMIGRKEDRDPHSPARKRWECLERELNSNFAYLDIGSNVYKTQKPIATSIASIPKPRLSVHEGGTPVKSENLMYALRKGPFKDPELDELFLFSVDDTLTNPFWEALSEYFQNNFGWTLPDRPKLLERSENEIRNYLEKRKAQDSLGKIACIAILEDESALHKTLTNLLAEYGIALQCLRRTTALSIVKYQRKSFLEGICAGIFAKSGGIPWLLHDPLIYERYAAIDVGREKTEWWAMGVVYDQKGLYEIIPGEMLVGEDLDVEALKSCASRAIRESVPNSFVILRDGDASSKELNALRNLAAETKIPNVALVSIKKNVPHRLFRDVDGEIYKPVSGDFLELDKNMIVICLAGVDRYLHGTPIPKVLEVIPVSGSIVPRDIAHDIFYLSFLNWGSPSHGYSSPAPLKLAHVLASDLSRGLRPFGPPF